MERKQLLFLHGYLSDRRAFAAQEKFFSRYFDCFSFDLPGFGKNTYMPYPYALSDYVAFVKEYMDKNRIVKPHVVAHSFGARIAVKAAAEDKELFSSLVRSGAAGMIPRRSFSYRLNRLRFLTSKRFFPKEKLEKYYSADYRALNDVMRKSFVKIVGEHLDGTAAFVENPVLLVYGAEDRETPLYMAKRYHKYIRGSRLIVIPRAGHFCFAEQAAAFNYPVREFLLSSKE